MLPQTGVGVLDGFLDVPAAERVVAALLVLDLPARLQVRPGDGLRRLVEPRGLGSRKRLGHRVVAGQHEPRVHPVSGRRARDCAVYVVLRADETREGLGVIGAQRLGRGVAGRAKRVLDVGLRNHREVARIRVAAEPGAENFGELHADAGLRALERGDHDARRRRSAWALRLNGHRGQNHRSYGQRGSTSDRETWTCLQCFNLRYGEHLYPFPPAWVPARSTRGVPPGNGRRGTRTPDILRVRQAL